MTQNIFVFNLNSFFFLLSGENVNILDGIYRNGPSRNFNNKLKFYQNFIKFYQKRSFLYSGNI